MTKIFKPSFFILVNNVESEEILCTQEVVRKSLNIKKDKKTKEKK
jgi:hypothetical protein